MRYINTTQIDVGGRRFIADHNGINRRKLYGFRAVEKTLDRVRIGRPAIGHQQHACERPAGVLSGDRRQGRAEIR
ncbi:MAG: hypothetical protein QM754_09335 [Tepidisphaeraceae bacterium]